MATRPSFWRIRENVAGLDIGQDYLAAAHVGSLRNGFLDLRRAACAGRSGNEDARTLSRRIRDLWRTARIGTTTVRVCLRSPSLIVKYMKLDHITQDEAEPAFRLEAETCLQLAPSGMAIDTWTQPAQGGVEGVLVAAPRSDVDDLLRIVRGAGLYPVAVDTACTAMAELAEAWRTRHTPLRPAGLAYASRHGVDLAVVGLGPPLYARSIVSRISDEALGATNLASAIGENLKYIRFKLHLPDIAALLVTGELSGRVDFLDAVRAHCPGVDVRAWNPLTDVVKARRRPARTLGDDETTARRAAAAIGLSARGG